MESLDKKLSGLENFKKFKQSLKELEDFRKMIELVKQYPIKIRETSRIYSPYSKIY